MPLRCKALVVLAMVTFAEARCGVWAGDEEAVARAVDTVAAVCPCGGDWRACVRRHVRAAASRIGLRKRCLTTAVRAARRRGCVPTTSTTSTTTSTATTSSTALRKGLLDVWRLEGQVTANACNVSPDFDTVITITSSVFFGWHAEGDRRAYYVMVEGDRWWLSSEWSGLGSCPTGEPGEPYWVFAGPRPDAETVITVTGALYWYGPIRPPDPCPGCTVLWEGTMRRE